MKLSLNMQSFAEDFKAGRMDIVSFLQFCRDAGIVTVDLQEQFLDRPVKELNDLLNSNGCRVATWFCETDFDKPAQQERETQIHHVRKSIDTAKHFGSSILCIAIDGLSVACGGDAINLTSESLAACIPLAQERGVVMAVINQGPVAGGSEALLSLVGSVDSPWLKASWDTAGSLYQGEDPLTALKQVLPIIGHVQYSDCCRCIEDARALYLPDDLPRYTGCTLGTGAVPLLYITGLLQSANYDGFVSLRYDGLPSKENVTASIDAIKRLIEVK